jgi:chromosome partitioning protein
MAKSSGVIPIIAVAAEKGGVAKTTTAVSLAHYLSRKHRVLLIDMDSQGQSGKFLGISGKYHMVDLIVNSNPKRAGYVPVENLLVNARTNLEMILNNQDLATAEPFLSTLMGREKIIYKRLEPILKNYGAVIIDIGPTVNLSSIAALYAANWLIVPVTPGAAPRHGLELLFDTIDNMKQNLDRYPELLAVLATMVAENENVSKLTLSYLSRHFPDTYAGIIHRNTALAEAPEHAKTIFEYKPASVGAKDYEAFGEWIEGRLYE